MMGEGWEWIHLASVGVVFTGWFIWFASTERKQ